jgi:drug/metabolite transporter (DMT)-like permease
LAGLAAVTLWGLSFVATRVALEAFHPVGLICTRLTLGTLLLGCVLKRRRGAWLPERRDLGLCAAMGCVLGAHYVIQTWGLEFTTAANAGWIVGFGPVVIVLGGWLFLGSRLRGLAWLGILVASSGLLLVCASAPPDFARARLGDGLQLIACGTWATYTLASTGAVARNGGLRVTAFTMGIAALATAAATPWSGWLQGELTLRALGAAAFLGFLCSAGALLLWARAVSSDGVAKAAATLYLEPFVTLVAALVLLAEPLVMLALVGGPIVLIGVWLVGCADRLDREPRGAQTPTGAARPTGASASSADQTTL